MDNLNMKKYILLSFLSLTFFLQSAPLTEEEKTLIHTRLHAFMTTNECNVDECLKKHALSLRKEKENKEMEYKFRKASDEKRAQIIAILNAE